MCVFLLQPFQQYFLSAVVTHLQKNRENINLAESFTLNIYIEGREGLYHQCFLRKTCPDGKAIFGQCSVLTEELRENCSDTFIISSQSAGGINLRNI